MLSTRLVIGLTMAAVFVGVLGLDEWLSPWHPLWFLTSLVVLGASAVEVVGLLNETSARPSGNTVFGGVMAMVVANWAPHVVAHVSRAEQYIGQAYDPRAPVHALSWPMWVFVAVLMF